MSLILLFNQGIPLTAVGDLSAARVGQYLGAADITALFHGHYASAFDSSAYRGSAFTASGGDILGYVGLGYQNFGDILAGGNGNYFQTFDTVATRLALYESAGDLSAVWVGASGTPIQGHWDVTAFRGQPHVYEIDLTTFRQARLVSASDLTALRGRPLRSTRDISALHGPQHLCFSGDVSAVLSRPLVVTSDLSAERLGMFHGNLEGQDDLGDEWVRGEWYIAQSDIGALRYKPLSYSGDAKAVHGLRFAAAFDVSSLHTNYQALFDINNSP